MIVYKNLKYLRTEKNLSYRELERLSGISCSIIFNIEHCRISDPSLSSIIGLSKALEIDIDSFVNIDLEKQALKRAELK